MTKPIEFIDLGAQRDRIRYRIDAAIKKVIDNGAYIMGPEVAEFERNLSAFSGAKHTLSCASGTDALLLPLMAWEVKAGDAVFCPSFTFAATAEVVALAGATPVFVDCRQDTMNIDAAGLKRAIEQVRRQGELTPRVVIAVDLFGQTADYPAIRAICDEYGLKLISDAAQGFGATLDGSMSNRWADLVATSFFPAKPLGCYGDGGAIQTDDAELHKILESLRVHGKGSDKYDNVRIGMNGRLDTIQAAVLIEKLRIFSDEIEARNRVAARYNEALGDIVTLQTVIDGAVSTWAQYTVAVKPTPARDNLIAALKTRGVPTAVYYPKPLHQQTAYKHYPVEGNGLPNSDDLAGRVLSLPMHPYLDTDTQDRIVEAFRASMQELRLAA